MKKFWIASVILAVVCLSCVTRQKVKKEDLTYSETVNVSGTEKDELFNNINMWCANNFTGPDLDVPVPEKSRILSSNKAQGTITANYTTVTEFYYTAKEAALSLVYSDVAITVSNGQYRLVFTAKDWQMYFPHPVNEPRQGYTKKEPVDGRLIEVTRKSWFKLADALRDTVSGTLVN